MISVPSVIRNHHCQVQLETEIKGFNFYSKLSNRFVTWPCRDSVASIPNRFQNYSLNLQSHQTTREGKVTFYTNECQRRFSNHIEPILLLVSKVYILLIMFHNFKLGKGNRGKVQKLELALMHSTGKMCTHYVCIELNVFIEKGKKSFIQFFFFFSFFIS